jgi:hypothetical protein
LQFLLCNLGSLLLRRGYVLKKGGSGGIPGFQGNKLVPEVNFSMREAAAEIRSDL